MIFSFPIDAWLLLFVAVGLGLALELVFYRARRADRAGHDAAGDGPATGRSSRGTSKGGGSGGPGDGHSGGDA